MIIKKNNLKKNKKTKTCRRRSGQTPTCLQNNYKLISENDEGTIQDR